MRVTYSNDIFPITRSLSNDHSPTFYLHMENFTRYINNFNVIFYE